MSEIGRKRRIFAQRFAQLLDWCFSHGYDVEIQQVLRTQADADANAEAGSGIVNSLHVLGLAGDITLAAQGSDDVLTDSADYQGAGVFWESLTTPDAVCCWGGRFSKPDGDHFSVEHNGVK